MGKFTNKIILPVVMAVAGTVLISCGKEYKVTFEGLDNSQTLIVKEDGTVKKPSNPEKTDAIFGGWYKDKDCTIEWDFDEDKITKDTQIYAKWIYLYNITIPNASLSADGYKVEIADNLTKISAGSNYQIKLSVDANVYNADSFVLMVNNENYAYPAYTEQDGIRTYIYTIENVSADQNISVVGLNKKYFTAFFSDTDKLEIEDIDCSRNAITYGSTYKFKVHLNSGYTQSENTMVVVYNNKQVIKQNGVYQIENVKNNLNISFTGLYKNTYSISLPYSTDTTPRFTITGNNNYSHGDEQTFELTLNESYKKINVKEELTLKVGGKIVAPEISYDTEKDKYIIKVSNVNAVGNIEILIDDSEWEVSKYNVNLKAGNGYHFETANEIDENGNCLVNFNGNIKFKLVLDDDYKLCDSFILKANNINITSLLLNTANNEIELLVKKDYEIKLENLTKNAYPVVKANGEEGYKIVSADGYSQPVTNGTYKFKIELDEGYVSNNVIQVKYYNYNPENRYYSYVNEGVEYDGNIRIIAKTNGYYLLQNITEGVRILVEGIEKQTFSVALPEKPNAYTIAGNSSVKYGEDYSFEITLNDDYKNSLNEMNVRYKGFSVSKTIVNDTTAKFTILNVKENISAGDLVVENIYKNEYTVTFTTVSVRNSKTITGKFKNYSGDEYTETTYTQVVKRGENAIAPTAEIVAPENYKLNENKPYSASFDKVNDDLIIYINYIPISYYITFDMQGGTNNPANNTEGGSVYKYSYNIEKTIDLKDPTKKVADTDNDYKFIGWFYEENGEWKNISEFTGYRNLEVKAVWQLEVGASKVYKTLTDAIEVVSNGDEILLEEGTYLNQSFATDLNLTIIGDGEVEIYLNNSFSGLWNRELPKTAYGIINSNNAELTIKNVKFIANGFSSTTTYAITSVGSKITLNNVQFEGLNALLLYGTADKNLQLNNVNIASDLNSYAIDLYALEDGFATNINNAEINALFGVNYNYYSNNKMDISIENSIVRAGSNSNPLIEGVAVRIDGEHSISKLNLVYANLSQSVGILKVDRDIQNIFSLDRINEFKARISCTNEDEASIEKAIDNEIVIENSGDAIYRILGRFEVDGYDTELTKLGISYIQNALSISNNVSVNGAVEISENLTIAENKTLILLGGYENILKENTTLTVAGNLTIVGYLKVEGTIVKELTGEITSTYKVLSGTQEDLGIITQIIIDGKVKQNLFKVENQFENEETGEINTSILGNITKANKNSAVVKLYETTSNRTDYYVPLRVYVGVEYADIQLDNIYITNVGGLEYANGTHKSDALTDKINQYGYLDVVLDCNVVNNVVGLTECKIEVNGKTYIVKLRLFSYDADKTGDRADSLGFEFNVNNDYEIVTKNETDYVSEKDNFSNFKIDGCILEGVNATKLNELNLDSTKYYVTFRKYVGLQYRGMEVIESYMYNGKTISNLNLYAKDSKNTVDGYGYLSYIFDANLDYTLVNGVKLYTSFDFENINIFFNLDDKSYEVRLEKGDLTAYIWNGKNVALGNTLDIGIENRFLSIVGSNNEYTISGSVLKVLDNSKIKNNSLFYDGANDADGYFVAYKIWLGKTDGTFKNLANKNVTVTLSNYDGRTYYNSKIGFDGYLDFITEIKQENSALVGGSLNISILVDGEEEAREFTITFENLSVRKEDKVADELYLVKDNLKAGIDVTTYNIEMVNFENGNYKIKNSNKDFVKTNANAKAYQSEYVNSNSTGYFVGLKWFVGRLNYLEEISVHFEFEKANTSVLSQDRILKVDKNGYISILIDTLYENKTLGIDKCTLTYSFNGEKTITLDFSSLVTTE